MAFQAGSSANDLRCTSDCDWYAWDFNTINKSLRKNLDSPGKVADYQLDRFPVDMEIKLNCAKKACAGDKKKLNQIRQNYGHIIGIVRSGQLKSPQSIDDDFSKYLKQ